MFPAIAATLALGLPTLLVALRAGSGALVELMPSSVALGAMSVASLVAIVGSRRTARRGALALAPVVALVIFAMVLAPRVDGSAGKLAIWMPVLGVAASSAWTRGTSIVRRVSSSAAMLKHPRTPLTERSISDDPGDFGELLAESKQRREADGARVATGMVRLDIQPGQRVGSAHVVFCPPLESVPVIDVEQHAGPPARIQLGRALAHGVRFDVKLAQESPRPETVWIEYVARTSVPLAPSSPGHPEVRGDNSSTAVVGSLTE